MVKNVHIHSSDETTYNAKIAIEKDLALIGDIVGFDITSYQTATFGSGSSNARDIINRLRVVVDGSKTLHDLQQFNDDSIMAILSMMAGIYAPTSEDLVTTNEKKLHFFLPFSIMRSLFQSAQLKVDLEAATDTNSNITAMTNKMRISARYGFVDEMVRFTSVLKSDAVSEYSIELPTDKGNLTGFFLCSTDADLIHPDTKITIDDESGLPMIDEMRASDIVAQNEQFMRYGWTGLYGAVYVLYVDVPLIACKPDLRIKVSCNGALTGGLQIYFLNSWSEQQIISPMSVSPKIAEIGAYSPDEISIRKYENLIDQIQRINAPMVSFTGEEINRIEKTIQK